MERRNTIQRELVLQAVRELGNHASADEVYSKITESHPSISKGTVYRNLNILSEEGKILKIEVPGAAEHFDHRCHDHFHVHCIKCGSVSDVDVDEIPDFIGSIKDSHGFDILGYGMMFKGVCPSCK